MLSEVWYTWVSNLTNLNIGHCRIPDRPLLTLHINHKILYLVSTWFALATMKSLLVVVLVEDIKIVQIPSLIL